MVRWEVCSFALNLEQSELGFQCIQTHTYIRTVYKEGPWSALGSILGPYLRVHIAATVSDYGQARSEGLRAFRGRQDARRAERY